MVKGFEVKKFLREEQPHGTPEFPIFVHEDIFIYNNGVFPPHWHNEFEILYLEKGRAKFYIDGESFILNDNEVLFVNCGSIHSGREIVRSIGYAIVFDLKFLFSEGPDIIKYKYFLPLQEGKIFIPNRIEDEELKVNISKIIKLFIEKPFTYELKIKSLLFSLFSKLFEYYVLPNPQKILDQKLNRIKNILEYINANYQKNFSLEELARIEGISKYYLCRIFKEVLSMSPIEYVNRVKIDKSLELLRNTDMSITEIALECGFSNISYFIKVFKEVTQTTPLKYKQKIKNL